MRKFLFGGVFLALAGLAHPALADAADPSLLSATPVSTPIVFEAATPAPTPIGGPKGPMGLTLSAQIGYTTVNMGDLNRSNAEFLGFYDGDGHSGAIHDGAVLDLNLVGSQWTAWPWLLVGLRAEYLRTGTSELLVHNILMSGDPVWFVMQDSASLMSGQLGLGINSPNALPGLDLGVFGWAGPGFARVTQDVNLSNNLSGGPQPTSGIYGAVGLVAQLEGSLSYQATPAVSFRFTGGWRWADVGGVTDSKGKPLYEILPALGYNGSPKLCPVNIDLSGATAKGSVDFAF